MLITALSSSLWETLHTPVGAEHIWFRVKRVWPLWNSGVQFSHRQKALNKRLYFPMKQLTDLILLQLTKRREPQWCSGEYCHTSRVGGSNLGPGCVCVCGCTKRASYNSWWGMRLIHGGHDIQPTDFMKLIEFFWVYLGEKRLTVSAPLSVSQAGLTCLTVLMKVENTSCYSYNTFGQRSWGWAAL